MPASTDLTTLDATKEHLHIEDTDEDALLAALINSASEAIERYTCRVFGSQEFTEYHDGAGRAAIVLRHLPVLSVASVHSDPDREFTEANLIDGADYTLDSEAGLIRLDAGTFAEGSQNVKVVYTAGYSAVPGDVALACRIVVAALWERSRRRHDGLSSDSTSGHALAYEAGWPAAVRRLLAPYVVPSV